MPINEKRDYEFRDAVKALIESAIPEDLQKRLKKAADDIAFQFTDGVEWWIKNEMAEYLSGYVQDMTDRAIESMLSGNEEMFRRYLKCEKNGWTGRDRDHPVIHGRLHEAESIKIRRSLCDAFPELLKTERVMDLEDEVRSLVEQVNKKERECEQLRDRLRDYA